MEKKQFTTLSKSAAKTIILITVRAKGTGWIFAKSCRCKVVTYVNDQC